MIPYSRQEVTQADIDSIVEVLRSDLITTGPMVPAFEKAVASKVNVNYAVALNSATSALHIACLALGLNHDDWLWTVPNTFVASANCGRYCGANIDFVDIDPYTYNIDVNLLRDKLSLSKKNNTLPKILISVHFAGQPTEQEVIWSLSKEFGFKVIEDASHAIGASRYGEWVGSCKWSDATVFSFHPVKIITTGEGGMTLTNDKELFLQMQKLRSHGIKRELVQKQSRIDGAWLYDQVDLGYNYRMSDIHAALGLSQLNRLSEFVRKRNKIASRYDELLKGLPLQTPKILPENFSTFHLYVVRLNLIEIKKTYLEIFNSLRDNGIGVNLHYIPVHLHTYYKRLGFSSGMFLESERYSKEAISLPIYPSLTFKEQIKIVSVLRETLK